MKAPPAPAGRHRSTDRQGRHVAQRSRARGRAAAIAPGVRATRRILAAVVVTFTAAATAVGATGGDHDPQESPSASQPGAGGTVVVPAAHHHLSAPTRATPSRQRVIRGAVLEPEVLAVPERGSGAFAVAAASRADPGSTRQSAEAALTYTVEVERELGFDLTAVATKVDRVLADPRGWAAAGHSLRRAAHGDFRVLLATPETADDLCAPLDTGGRLSCRNGPNVVINAWRWANGTPDYQGHLAAYRTYVINHEVGHALGYGHTACPESGAPAPVMQQQTKGLDGCRRNVWPATADVPLS